MKKIFIFFQEHTSFLFIVLGSLSIYISNIFLKDILNPEDYGKYSLVITYISLISSFGLLGLEQVLLRMANIDDKNIIKTNRFLIRSIVFVAFIVSLLFSLIFQRFFLKDINFISLYVLTITAVITMLGYNIFRLNKLFVYAQVFNNLWKIALGIAVLMSILFFSLEFLDVYYSILFSLLLFSTITIVFVFKKISILIDISDSRLKVIGYSFHFFLALFSLSLINYGDKFFVEQKFGLEVVGEYFFLVNLYVFPFSILQSYIGFKELVAFKVKYNKQFFFKKMRMINILGIFLSLFLLCITFIIINYTILLEMDIYSNIVLILILLFTGIIKLNYSLYSSVFGAQAELKSIKKANLYFIIFSIIIIGISFFLITSLESLAFTVMTLWFVRVWIWKWRVNKIKVE